MGLLLYRNQILNILRVGDELIEIFFPRKTRNYLPHKVIWGYLFRKINSLWVLAFKNCGVARRTVAMKQTSFPKGTRQGLERAPSKPLQEGLGTGGGEETQVSPSWCGASPPGTTERPQVHQPFHSHSNLGMSNAILTPTVWEPEAQTGKQRAQGQTEMEFELATHN